MITTLELTGFKSFVADAIDFAPLTLLTGLNSSGKSSVIQALLLLEKAAAGQLPYLEGHGALSESKNPYSTELELAGTLDSGEHLLIQYTDKEGIKYSSASNFPEIIYISADRFGPETFLGISNTDTKLGKRGENLFKCILAHADQELHPLLRHEKSEGDTFLFNLRAWLGVVSPNVKLEVFLEAKTDLSFSRFNGYRAKNVGFGLSYSLSVITALLLGSITPNSLVIIENPEAHLHPRGQTEIARLISLCAETGTQVLIETHSDHLFNGVRIHAKNSGRNFHEQVKMYWFELDAQRNSVVEEISIDHNGRMTNAPKGFFDQFEINALKLI